MPLPTLADTVQPPPPKKRRRKRAPAAWWLKKRYQALAVVAAAALTSSLCAVYGRCEPPTPGVGCHLCNVLRPVAKFLALGLGV